MPAGFAGRAVAGWGKRMVGGDRDEIALRMLERNAEQLFSVLGELKGGAMKLGQALSVYETMVPTELAEPYRIALTKLQTQGPGMPARTVHDVLDRQLGRNWRTRFSSFDDEPAAAASIGQVHRGVWRDGREVAIKIQYPGADVALQTDLKTLQRFSRFLTLVIPSLDAQELVREVRDRMLEELDYRAEADHQRRFAEVLRGDPAVRVPEVLASAPKVIISEWLDGEKLSERLNRDDVDEQMQKEHDSIAQTMIELLFSSPSRIGLLHADPHPGNFLILRDGRIGIVDFGAVAVLPDGTPPVLGRIVRLAADRDADELMTLLHAERFVVGDIPPADVLRWLGALADPLRSEEFHFNRAWIAREGQRVTNVRSDAYLKTARSFNLPAEYMLVVRVTGGWMNILAQLGATVHARAVASRWLNGFGD